MPENFGEIHQWAKEHGFALNNERPDGYPLFWHDPAGQLHIATVKDLAQVKPMVDGLIARREAAVPGEWYLHWWVERSTPPWFPIPRWVHLEVTEGLPLKDKLAKLHPRAETGFDPTAFPSPDHALAQATLFPLELNAASRLAAAIVPLSGNKQSARVNWVTDEMVDMYVLLCLRYYATYAGPSTSGWLSGSDGWEWIAQRMWNGVGASLDEVKSSLERLIAQGTLRWDGSSEGIYVDNPIPKRWWTDWEHHKDNADSSIRYLTVCIKEMPEGKIPHKRMRFADPIPNGWDGPFDDENQARENVASYSIRHGILVGPITTEGMQRGPHMDYRKEWGDWNPPRPGIREEGIQDFPMRICEKV